MSVLKVAWTVVDEKTSKKTISKNKKSEKGKMDGAVWFGSLPIVSCWHLPSLGDPRRNGKRNL